jgi:hypothetical protein
MVNESTLIGKSNDELREMIISLMERAIQSHLNSEQSTEEDFLSLNLKYWSKYYTMLKQYDYDSRIPFGFYVDQHNESAIVLIRKVF